MNEAPWLNVAAWLPCTEAEGPGRRAALWVQGCDKRCAGCCNPGMLAFVERQLTPAYSIVDRLREAQLQFGIEGITLLGGEPMLQAQGLSLVAREAQAMGLSVMVFSGYTIDELERLQPVAWRALLEVTDVLVDGPYLLENPDTKRRWIGSRNQRVYYLSSRYDSSIERLDQEGRDIELRFGTNGDLRINGWPIRLARS